MQLTEVITTTFQIKLPVFRKDASEKQKIIIFHKISCLFQRELTFKENLRFEFFSYVVQSLKSLII